MNQSSEEFIERVAIQLNNMDADDHTAKWEKQPGKYRASIRRDVRDAIATLDFLGYGIEKRQALAAKDAEIAKLRKALEEIAGETGRFNFPWPETHEDYPAFAVMRARSALRGEA